MAGKKLTRAQQLQSMQDVANKPLMQGLREYFGTPDPTQDLARKQVDIKLDPTALRAGEEAAHRMMYPTQRGGADVLPPKPRGEYQTEISDKEAEDSMKQFEQSQELKRRLLQNKLNNY